MEENLFPSQLSVNSRTELEEERRLFYVAITRAEEKLTLSFAATRYRWGNLVSSEPSRFLQEVDPDCFETPLKSNDKHYEEDDDVRGGWSNENGQPRKFNPSPRIGAGTKPGFIKTTKPAAATSTNGAAVPLGFKKVNQARPQQETADFQADDSSLITMGMDVEHQRFGFGKVISIEGRSPENKALILFEGHGQKQLLLKFAKLRIVRQ
jgi:DNA helicase-2/ATP-dependent DNA helicase PcrA